MKLLGKWNWWMPRSLNWLPSLGEASHAPVAEGARS